MKRLTIEQMQALAKERNGVCLSKTYGGALSKLRWRCVEGHEWEARPNNVKNGSWCPACLRGTIEEMQVLAKDRGGECLSTKYVNAKTKLRWRCSEGHEWEAVPSSVQRGKWCPRCSQGNSERIVRDICEQLFGDAIPKGSADMAEECSRESDGVGWLLRATLSRVRVSGTTALQTVGIFPWR